jgi:hypothetical protein
MLGHVLLERLDAELAAIGTRGHIAVTGDWTSRTRRAYRGGVQFGSGAGPYVDVVDHAWEGRLRGPSAFTGMAFMQAESGLHWAKAAHTSEELSVRVSMHGYANDNGGRITFAAGLDDVFLPGVPADRPLEQPSACLLATDAIRLGRVTCLARAGDTAFFVLLFASDSVKFGRNRLWRLRDSIVDNLPPDLRELLTRRRAGLLRLETRRH